MNYQLKPLLPSGQFSLPLELVDILSEVGETELKILITVYAHASRNSLETISEDELFKLCINEGYDNEMISASVSFWRGAGYLKKANCVKKAKAQENIVETPKKENTIKSEVNQADKLIKFEPDKKLDYSGEELAKAAEKSDFRALIEYTQERLGKLINQTELNILYSLYDYLKMPVDVIMLAIEHCASEGKGSIRYVEKLLISFADNDINTYEKAEKYINDRKKFKSHEGKIRNLCGFGDRTLTAKEKAVVSMFIEKNVSFDLIESAYEKTISAIQKPSLNYMNKIISGWLEAGYKNPADIESGETGRNETGKSYDLDDFFTAAVSKGRDNT